MQVSHNRPVYDDGGNSMLMLANIMLMAVFAAGIFVGATLF